jgi:hypothetical protein
LVEIHKFGGLLNSPLLIRRHGRKQIPRQQLRDSVDGMIGNAPQHRTQVRLTGFISRSNTFRAIFGRAGKLPKEFGTVNAIDCRDGHANSTSILKTRTLSGCLTKPKEAGIIKEFPDRDRADCLRAGFSEGEFLGPQKHGFATFSLKNPSYCVGPAWIRTVANAGRSPLLFCGLTVNKRRERERESPREKNSCRLAVPISATDPAGLTENHIRWIIPTLDHNKRSPRPIYIFLS